MTRRTFLSGLAAGVGAAAVAAVPTDARATSATAQRPRPGTTPGYPLNTVFAVPFSPSGLIGGCGAGCADHPDYHQYIEQILEAAIIPPLSDVVIYTHGWLTSATDLMLTYDTLVQGFDTENRTLRNVPVSWLAPPTEVVGVTTHWPSLPSEDPGSPRNATLFALASFSPMEARANLIGATGMARLIRTVWRRLLAEPQLASTRLSLIGHSFGGRILANALQVLADEAGPAFVALQDRNPINLVLLEPAFPADALEPNDLTHAYPYAQLANYQNLRILTTWSGWDRALRGYYPGAEAQMRADPAYDTAHVGASMGIPALGGIGPSDATWTAFNGNLPRADISVGPGFGYADLMGRTEHRLTVANLTPLHAAHHKDDTDRPGGEMPPYGRPDKHVAAYIGYHNDVYCPEVYRLQLGYMFAQRA